MQVVFAAVLLCLSMVMARSQPKVVGCKFIDEQGQVKQAVPGKSYNDGCNECRCSKMGGACTKMACPNKCRYMHWSKTMGYAEAGRKGLQVYDAKNDCRKYCKCVKGKKGAMLQCRDRCIGKKPKAVCKFVAKNGKVGQVKVGMTYNNGCSECRCTKAGSACTKKGCPNMCRYMHWSKMIGYAKPGSMKLRVYDAKNRCRKLCKCVKGKKGAMTKCPKRCSGKKPKASCKYVGVKGKVRRVKVGKTYNNGCNNCRCTKAGGSCARKACPNMCRYMHWSKMIAYSKLGRKKLQVYDDKNRCRRLCKCVKGKKVVTLSCSRCLVKKPKSSCKFVDNRGRVRQVKIGQMYNAGCNKCRCTKAGGDCPKKSCPNMCRYMHWSKAVGYAMAGEKRTLKVYIAKNGCRKKCKCVKGKKGTILQCTKACYRKKRKGKRKKPETGSDGKKN